MEVRKRKSKKVQEGAASPPAAAAQDPHICRLEPVPLIHQFWLSRIVFLRALAFIYLVAFLIGYQQNKELLGDNGLLPVRHFFQHLAGLTDDPWKRFLSAPSLLWLAEPWHRIDAVLDGISIVGMVVAGLILVTGAANFLALFTLWGLYHSLVNVGQRWYAFGWESQLLETGFLAMWLVPFLSWHRFPRDVAPPWTGIVGYRWLILRIMVGAGLIKIRGDACWRDLTCMNYFYETQPNPNPQAYFAHQAPEFWHKFETFGNHVVELVLPFFTLLPFRWAGLLNGGFQILFQVILISTGNLSFLNWLTILPSIWFFDDQTLAPLFSQKALDDRTKAGQDRSKEFSFYRTFRQGINMSVAMTIAFLSMPIVTNLISPNQVMNTSFEPFR